MLLGDFVANILIDQNKIQLITCCMKGLKNSCPNQITQSRLKGQMVHPSSYKIFFHRVQRMSFSLRAQHIL